MAYKANPIYWSTANLIVDSGSYNTSSNDSTDYGKMAVAIAMVQQEGVKVQVPLINKAEFEFQADEGNNLIIFSLKGINSINTELSKEIVEHRPYKSFDDFCEKMIDTNIIKNAQMNKLIKGGCFNEFMDRKEAMKQYINKYLFKRVTNLTLSQLKKLQEFDMVPEEHQLAIRLKNYSKYVLDEAGFYSIYINPEKKVPKCGYHDRYYILDDNSQPFFTENFSEDSIVDIIDTHYLISEKKFVKELDKKLGPFKTWMASEEAVNQYNKFLFEEIWNKEASGNEAAWSMSALSYYDQEHELAHVSEEEYGIVNFFDLPEEPEPYDFYSRYIDRKLIKKPKYTISRIAGTVLKADNMHYMVSLLTTHGVVNVKFSKGHYTYYNKRISAKEETGKKKVLEESWLKRGNLLMIHGIRRGDTFYPLVYKDTIYKHTLNLINRVSEDGSLLIQSDRISISND